MPRTPQNDVTPIRVTPQGSGGGGTSPVGRFSAPQRNAAADLAGLSQTLAGALKAHDDAANRDANTKGSLLADQKSAEITRKAREKNFKDLRKLVRDGLAEAHDPRTIPAMMTDFGGSIAAGASAEAMNALRHDKSLTSFVDPVTGAPLPFKEHAEVFQAFFAETDAEVLDEGYTEEARLAYEAHKEETFEVFKRARDEAHSQSISFTRLGQLTDKYSGIISGGVDQAEGVITVDFFDDVLAQRNHDVTEGGAQRTGEAFVNSAFAAMRDLAVDDRLEEAVQMAQALRDVTLDGVSITTDDRVRSRLDSVEDSYRNLEKSRKQNEGRERVAAVNDATFKMWEEYGARVRKAEGSEAEVMVVLDQIDDEIMQSDADYLTLKDGTSLKENALAEFRRRSLPYTKNTRNTDPNVLREWQAAALNGDHVFNGVMALFETDQMTWDEARTILDVSEEAQGTLPFLKNSVPWQGFNDQMSFQDDEPTDFHGGAGASMVKEIRALEAAWAADGMSFLNGLDPEVDKTVAFAEWVAKEGPERVLRRQEIESQFNVLRDGAETNIKALIAGKDPEAASAAITQARDDGLIPDARVGVWRDEVSKSETFDDLEKYTTDLLETFQDGMKATTDPKYFDTFESYRASEDLGLGTPAKFAVDKMKALTDQILVDAKAEFHKLPLDQRDSDPKARLAYEQATKTAIEKFNATLKPTAEEVKKTTDADIREEEGVSALDTLNIQRAEHQQNFTVTGADGAVRVKTGVEVAAGIKDNNGLAEFVSEGETRTEFTARVNGIFTDAPTGGRVEVPDDTKSFYDHLRRSYRGTTSYQMLEEARWENMSLILEDRKNREAVGDVQIKPNAFYASRKYYLSDETRMDRDEWEAARDATFQDMLVMGGMSWRESLDKTVTIQPPRHLLISGDAASIRAKANKRDASFYLQQHEVPVPEDLNPLTTRFFRTAAEVDRIEQDLPEGFDEFQKRHNLTTAGALTEFFDAQRAILQIPNNR